MMEPVISLQGGTGSGMSLINDAVEGAIYDIAQATWDAVSGPEVVRLYIDPSAVSGTFEFDHWYNFLSDAFVEGTLEDFLDLVKEIDLEIMQQEEEDEVSLTQRRNMGRY